MFTEEQNKVINLYDNGYSFFLTGKGGCGKSFILKQIIQIATRQHGGEAVGVTGPTGKSSENIGGQTIHSWAGIGIGERSRYQLLDEVLANPQAKERWQKCKVLIVDEVSLLSKELFEKLEFIARRVKGVELPFGSIQLIFSGDFYQIPPVTPANEELSYCFQSAMWPKCFDVNVELTRNMRQSQPEFVSLLNEIRHGGELSPYSLNMLQTFSRSLQWQEGETPLKLFSTRSDVEDENNRMLKELEGDEKVFKAIDGGPGKANIDKSCPASRCLSLKVGAPVMLIKNSPHVGLVNGSLGTVVNFVNNYPQVLFENGKKVIVRYHTWSICNEEGVVQCTRRQIPLILSWALTIHKAQGLTFDKAEVSLANMFIPGLAYVALSRVRTLEGLRVIPGFDVKLPSISDCVSNFYNTSVVAVLDINITGPPCRLNIPDAQISEPAELSKEIAATEPTRHNWNLSLPLPAGVECEKIMDSLRDDPLNSENTNSVIDMLYSRPVVSEMIQNFICYSWWKMEGMIAKSTQVSITVIPKKKWVGHAGELHKYKISDDTSSRWTEVIERSNLSKDLTEEEKRSTMSKLIDKIRCFLIDYIYLEREAEPEEEIVPPNTHLFTKECQGKIRYLAGWTVRKELQACNRYTTTNKSSKNRKVAKRCEREDNMKSVLKKLVETQTTLEYNSKHQESLQYTQSHNRGGLTNVSDTYYEFTVAIETSCKKHFTPEKLDKHKWDACKIAREQVKKDPTVKIALNELESKLELSEEEKEVLPSVISRLVKRYLNMRSKEYVKVLKRKMKCEKSKEHRKKVTQKNDKKKKKINIIQEITEDQTANKMSAFFTIKAVSARGSETFCTLSKSDIHFIYHLFGMGYRHSANKTDLVHALRLKIEDAQMMTHPELCNKTHYEEMQADKSCTVCSENRHQNDMVTTEEQNNGDSTHQDATRTRRKQFKPSQDQKRILEKDHIDGLDANLLQRRAAEFSVDVSQIRSWHTRYRKRLKDTNGN